MTKRYAGCGERWDVPADECHYCGRPDKPEPPAATRETPGGPRFGVQDLPFSEEADDSDSSDE